MNYTPSSTHVGEADNIMEEDQSRELNDDNDASCVQVLDFANKTMSPGLYERAMHALWYKDCTIL